MAPRHCRDGSEGVLDRGGFFGSISASVPSNTAWRYRHFGGGLPRVPYHRAQLWVAGRRLPRRLALAMIIFANAGTVPARSPPKSPRATMIAVAFSRMASMIGDSCFQFGDVGYRRTMLSLRAA